MRDLRIALSLCALLCFACMGGFWAFYKVKVKQTYMKVSVVICGLFFVLSLVMGAYTCKRILNYTEVPEVPMSGIMDMMRQERENEIEDLQRQGLIITDCEFGGISDTEKGSLYFFRSGKDIIYVIPQNNNVKDRLRMIVQKPIKDKYSIYGGFTESEVGDDDVVHAHMIIYELK